MTKKDTFTPDATIRAAGQMTVGNLFSSTARASADHVAIVDGERQLTFQQLDERTSRLANAFLKNGLKRGDRIAVLALNCQEYLEIELAAAKAGLIVAALNWRLADRELRYCIELVEPSLIILQSEYEPTIGRLEFSDIPCLTIGLPYENYLASGEPTAPPAVLDGEDGLVILYTCGTTGMPKGAL